MTKRLDLTGLAFERLTAIEYIASNNAGLALWYCECECGNYAIAIGRELKRGRIKSCGCLRSETRIRENTTHNATGTKLYKVWCSMRRRCYNANTKDYKWYGGKDIKLCEAWDTDFRNFETWALANGYKNNLTIDRIDSKKDYSPDNCQWLTHSENSRKAAIEMWLKIK